MSSSFVCKPEVVLVCTVISLWYMFLIASIIVSRKKATYTAVVTNTPQQLENR